MKLLPYQYQTNLGGNIKHSYTFDNACILFYNSCQFVVEPVEICSLLVLNRVCRAGLGRTKSKNIQHPWETTRTIQGNEYGGEDLLSLWIFRLFTWLDYTGGVSLNFYGCLLKNMTTRLDEQCILSGAIVTNLVWIRGYRLLKEAWMKEVPEKLDWQERERLRGVVRQLLGHVREEYVVQVERVLVALLYNERKDSKKIESKDNIISTFKLNKRIPQDSLNEALEEQDLSISIAEAVCFAACYYPNMIRVSRWNEEREREKLSKSSEFKEKSLEQALTARMKEVDSKQKQDLDNLKESVTLFLAIYRDNTPPIEALKQRIGNLSKTTNVHTNKGDTFIARLAQNPEELLNDLTSNNSIPTFTEKKGRRVLLSQDEIDRAKKERRDGAILYLLCLPRELLTIIQNWHEEKELLRVFRDKFMQSPPIAADCIGSRSERGKQALIEEIERELVDFIEGIDEETGLKKESDFAIDCSAVQLCPNERKCVGLCQSDKILKEKLRYRLGPIGDKEMGQILSSYFIACKKANYHVGFNRLLDEVEHFWEDKFDELTCGFPYFAFRSRFTYWWKTCIKNHHWYRGPSGINKEEMEGHDSLNENEPEFVQNKSEIMIILPDGYMWTLEPATIHIYSEGYRLVRTTFFPGKAVKKVDLNFQKLMGRTEYSRMAIDEIWFSILKGANSDDDKNEDNKNRKGKEEKKDLDKTRIMTKYGVTDQWYDTVKSRLAKRMRAYHLARVERFTLNEILKSKQTVYGKKDKRFKLKNVFSDDDIFSTRMIACLAKTVPPEHTFLWAFTSHVLLHSSGAGPGRRDQWDLKRFLSELWWWLSPDAFSKCIDKGVADSSHSHKYAKDLAAQRRVKLAITRLRQIEASSEHFETCKRIREGVERFLERRGTRFRQSTDFALKALLTFFNTPDWNFCSIDKFCDYKDICENEIDPSGQTKMKKEDEEKKNAELDIHWIIPIWYLINVERYKASDSVRRLIPDRHNKRNNIREDLTIELAEKLANKIESYKPF